MPTSGTLTNLTVKLNKAPDNGAGTQQEVFTMVDLEQRPVQEVAETLGIAPSTVRVLLARARQTIRLRMLAEHPDLLQEFGR